LKQADSADFWQKYVVLSTYVFNDGVPGLAVPSGVRKSAVPLGRLDAVSMFGQPPGNEMDSIITLRRVFRKVLDNCADRIIAEQGLIAVDHDKQGLPKGNEKVLLAEVVSKMSFFSTLPDVVILDLPGDDSTDFYHPDVFTRLIKEDFGAHFDVRRVLKMRVVAKMNEANAEVGANAHSSGVEDIKKAVSSVVDLLYQEIARLHGPEKIDLETGRLNMDEFFKLAPFGGTAADAQTHSETEAVVAFLRTQPYRNVAMIASPLHQLRAFVTLVSSVVNNNAEPAGPAVKSGNNLIKIFNFNPQNTYEAWSLTLERYKSSSGDELPNRAGMVPGQVNRLGRYANLLPPARIIEYVLNERGLA
jgi:hypothetical protein